MGGEGGRGRKYFILHSSSFCCGRSGRVRKDGWRKMHFCVRDMMESMRFFLFLSAARMGKLDLSSRRLFLLLLRSSLHQSLSLMTVIRNQFLFPRYCGGGGGEVLKGEAAEAHMLANIQEKEMFKYLFHFFLTRLCGKLVVVAAAALLFSAFLFVVNQMRTGGLVRTRLST